jgi:hypothetical protein
MNHLSGIYYGAMIHPSYNKCQGQNGLPLLHDIQDACTTMAYSKCIAVPIYYFNNCSSNDKSDSSEVFVDNECDAVPLQHHDKASLPVEFHVDKKDDRAGSKDDGFVLNLLHDSNDSRNNEKCISKYDLF